MKKRWFPVGVVLLVVSLLVAGCGVPQEEHDAVLAERDGAQAEVASLQSDLTEVQSDLAAAESDLADTESDLAKAQSELDDVELLLLVEQGKYAASQGEVSSLQSELAEVQSDPALEALYNPSYDNTVIVDTFQGTWKGTLSMLSQSTEFELRIAGNSAWVVFSSGERSLTMVRLGPNLILYFMNQGGIWTETQVYTLSSLTKDSVQILYTRQVHNEGSTTWSLQGSGVLQRQ